MNIYLYIKTHNITGLKYLGHTTQLNPYTYKGSGKYWISHIKKHGYDVTTEILKECNTKDEIAQWGLYYSELYNVVNDDNWANLVSESGVGMIHTPETIAKQLATRKANGNLIYNTPETIAKQLATRKANGTLSTVTPESLAARTATKRINGTLNTNTQKEECPHCGKIIGRPNYIKSHGTKCKEFRS